MKENIKFELNDIETQRALLFMKEHDHRYDLKKDGKLSFSTLGMQFTYIITPGGLGDCVTIKCNYCDESRVITDIDSW
jgi:hypothetical protein